MIIWQLKRMISKMIDRGYAPQGIYSCGYLSEYEYYAVIKNYITKLIQFRRTCAFKHMIDQYTLEDRAEITRKVLYRGLTSSIIFKII